MNGNSDQAAKATTVRPKARAAVKATTAPPWLEAAREPGAALGREELEAAAFPLPLPLPAAAPEEEAAVGAVAAPVLGV